MIDRLLSLIHDNERFVITTHVRPDGDALGSQLALRSLLEKLGKKVAMINQDPPSFNLSWIPGVNDIEVFTGAMRQREAIAESDVIFIVDTNSADRIGRLGHAVRNSEAVKVLIDHHPGPEAWFDVVLQRESASSTGELIYELVASEDPSLIDAEMATTLYVAIMTDTGSFRFSSVTPQVHRIIAELLERGGIRPEAIHSALFDNRTVEGLRLLSRSLDTLSLYFDGLLGYMVVAEHMLHETGADIAETEGFVNYVLSVEGVKVALLFTETSKGTKISFRSKEDVYVHEWAQAMGGGGHRYASGAFVKKPLDATIRAALKAAPRYLPAVLPREMQGEALSSEDAALLTSLLDLQSPKTSS